MKTNNTQNIDFDDIIYTIALILSIIAFIFIMKYSIEELEDSIPKSTYVNTLTQVIDSHEDSESETTKYIDQIPNKYRITYGWFDPNTK